MTITGIDMVSGLGLIATIGDHTRFASSEKLVSYLGLNPSVRQSGSGPARHGRITKRGANHARALLVEAAWAASRVPGPLRSVLHAGDVAPGKPGRSRGNCKEAGDDHMACFESPGGLRVRPSEPCRSEAQICRAPCWNATPAGRRGIAAGYYCAETRAEERERLENAERAYERVVSGWRQAGPGSRPTNPSPESNTST